MKLADLAQYAKQKYQIEEEYKWPDFPAYSVMRNPQTGTWIAVCIREWNESLGKTIERCDLKCGQFNIYKYHLPYFSLPFRMHGSNWLGIDIEQCSAPHLIQSLFDHAINAENKRSLKKYSDISATHIQQTTYRDSAIPAPGTTPQNIPNVPAKIFEMIKLYQFGDGSFLQKCKMFYIQGMFMKDYEDDVEYECYLQRFMPTYRDLKIEQLRSYFTWRTKLRKGDYQPAPTPFVYIYIYELINQIGTDSPEDSLQKMKQFDIQYHGNEMEDINIKNTLHKWMMDFAVLQRIAPKIAIEYADEKTLKIDKAMAILSHPDDNTEDAIVQSLCSFANAQFKSSPVIENHAEGKRLTAEIWRYLVHHYHIENLDIITACFSHPVPLPYYPLNNAVYWERRALPATMEYRLNSCRKYLFTNGKWTQHCYMTTYFDTAKFNGLLHEIDRKLRLYLKTKRNLKAKPEESWAEPFIDAVLQADKQAKLEAAKPKIHIDFSGLAQIRQDASITRDRLLTEEETDLDTTSPSTSKGEELPDRAEEKSKEQRVIDGLYNHNEIDLPEQSVPNSLELEAWSLEKEQTCSELKAQNSNLPTQTNLPLDAVHWHILNLLLQGESVQSYISAQHLMPTIVADTINEALFDEIGDNAIECDGDTLTIVEDYVDDVRSVIEQFPQ